MDTLTIRGRDFSSTDTVYLNGRKFVAAVDPPKPERFEIPEVGYSGSAIYSKEAGTFGMYVSEAGSSPDSIFFAAAEVVRRLNAYKKLVALAKEWGIGKAVLLLKEIGEE